jgi:predicted ATPase
VIGDDFGIGTRVGEYELLEPLGRGSTGTVWKAWSPGHGRIVALKLLRTIDPTLVKRALREGNLHARVRSEYTVELFEVFEHRSSPVLAMEYVAGPTLLQVLHQRRLGLSEADELARGLFLGLAAAHAEGVIHRDIKPGNILMPARDGPLHPKLADFGLARVSGGTGALTAADILLGTPGYMAPEQIADPRTAGVAADLFSLGVVLYRVVTGRLPYRSARRAEVLARTAAGRHTPVAELRPDAPERMVLAIESALRPDPRSRPASVDALREIWDGLAEPPTVVAPVIEEAPIEPTVSSPSGAPSWNIVRPAQGLCGRETELAEVAARLADWPLTTLVGLGGVGKTRLAVEAALVHQAGGGSAWLIDLSEATDLVALCTAVAATVGGRVDEAAPLQGVPTRIADAERPLVVLDHAEGVAGCLAEAITSWTGAAPEARFLITSRRHLGLPGEVTIEIGPLASPAAVALFEQQAQRVKPIFVVDASNRGAVVELVARLDHHPLAVEIAASRVRLLPPARLLERLGPKLDLVRRGMGPTRLDSMLQWSWDQLPSWGQASLAACSVFRGGFSLEAAEFVLAPVLDGVEGAPWPMDALQVLVDHCLVRVSEPLTGVERFTLPATVHAFAAEQRVDDGLPTRHARFYGALGRSDRMRPLTGHGGRMLTRLLALERDNLHAGARAGLVRSEPEVAAGCALAWAWLVRIHGPYEEGIRLLQQILILHGLQPQTIARLDRSLGQLRHLSGRLEEAVASLERAAAGFSALGDRRGEGVARGNLADVLADRGDDAAAAEEYQRALASLAGRHRAAAAVIGGNLANLLRRVGDLPGSERAYRDALTLSRQLHDQRAIGITQANLASLLMDLGRLDDAESAYAEALATAEALDDARTEGLLRGNLGLLRRMQGDDAGAAAELEAAIALARRVGHRANECLARGNLGDLLLERGDLRGAEEQLAAAVALGDQALPLAAAAFRGSLGELRFRQGDRTGGRALLAEAERALGGRDPAELAKVRARRKRLEEG